MRLGVRKTYKLFIGGKFPRSESGRVYPVADSKDEFLANVAMASRKDARDAVVAARAAQSGWAGATAYNRGQVLYRIAEMLEGRREQFVAEIRALTGKSDRQANQEVDAAIDSWVWHAGWTDKIDAVAGNMNPVAGPFFKSLVSKQLADQLPQPHVVRVPVVLRVPEHVDGNFWQFDGVG